MRGTYALGVAAGVTAGAALLVSALPSSQAQQNKAEVAKVAAVLPTDQLPIGRVVLYSSGVGYFQREGSVEGDARVDLSFPISDVNDLIKSMVLRDLDGGLVTAVSYDSNSPLERTLKSFAVNLNGNPAFADILNQARGEKVEIALQQTQANQPSTMSGTVVGVETQRVAVGKDQVVEQPVLNLWCTDGVRAVKLAELQRVRFLNPSLEKEFKQALEALSLSHDTQKKAVSVSFSGEGKRRVRVGYVVENPVWKTSYRLVLDAEKKPQLQGWAVVDNPSDEDWRDVRMTLVAGRPISFQMNLYDPLFVTRPTVEPELFASLRPVAYSGGMDGEFDRLAEKAKQANGKAQFGLGAGGGFGGLGAAPRDQQSMLGHKMRKEDERLDLSAGVRSMAQATRLGDFFQYGIEHPVSLARQKSALLPILAKEVEASRVSIYNERTQAKFPLLGLRLKNTSGAHLNQGPITVFDGSNYAGDARILDLQPEEERLVSFAVDLGTEVEPKPHNDNGRITSLRLSNGLVYTSTKFREAKTYTVANRNDQERTVLVEHPVRKDFTLVDTEKPQETAQDVYRFELKVPTRKTGTLTVTEERTVNETVQIGSSDSNRLNFFLSQPVLSEAVKKALSEAIKRRGDLETTRNDLRETERQLKVLSEDQARLRANLREVPANSPIHKKYLDKLEDQEATIEKLQAQQKSLQGQEATSVKSFDSFLRSLDVK